MLESMRRGAGTWVAKLFIGLLVLSFAVWGIADIFSGFRGTAVATVGETDIEGEDYRRQFQIEVQNTSRRIGQPLNFETARALGVDRLVLNRLIAEAALDDTSSSMNLRVTEKAIADGIKNDPAFQGGSGTFDRNYFEAAIRSLGLSEAGYVVLRRRLMARQALADAVGADVSIPNALSKAIANFRFEARQIRYLEIGAENAGDLPSASETDLRAYFDENKAEFRAPEYREIKALKIEPSDVTDEAAVTDDEIRETYESRIASYTTPEKRRVKQIVFDSLEAATNAKEALAAGKSLDDIAFEMALSPDDVELGLIGKTEIADPKVAEAAFALEEGASSDLIVGRFGTVIVSVAEVQPESTKTLDEVAAELRKDIALARAEQELLDLYDAIEDDRAGGMTLDEIASAKNLPLLTVAATDASGKNPDGADVDLPQKEDVLRASFDSDVGIENDPEQLGDKGFVWFDVVSITPERDRSFEEAKALVEDAYRAEKTAEQLNDFAKSLAERIKGGEDMTEVAKSVGVPLTRTRPITRGDRDAGFTEAGLKSMFSTPKTGVGVTDSEGGAKIVFRIEDIIAPTNANDALPDEIASDLNTGFTQDLVSQYVGALRDQVGVTVNEPMITQALGLGSQAN